MKTTLLSLAICLGNIISIAQNLIPFQDENGKWGYKNSSGNEIVQPIYEDVEEFSEGLGGVRKDNKWGFIDLMGKIIIPLKYQYLMPFSEGVASIKLNDKWGCIDKTGKLIIDIKYDFIDQFVKGLAPTYFNGVWGCLNKNGKTIIPFKYGVLDLNYDSNLIRVNFGGQMSEEDWSVANGGKWGYIDKSGKEIIPFKFDHAELFRNGYASVTIDNKAGIINQNGETILDFKYLYVNLINDSMVIVMSDSMKNGIYDIKGNEILPIVYDDIFSYNDSLFAICLNMKWAFADKNIKFLTTHKYNGLFRLNIGAEVFPVNIGGIYKPPYADETEGGKWGFVNGKGEEIIPFNYDKVHYVSGGYYFVCKEKKWGVINGKGIEITPIKYDEIDNASGFYFGKAQVTLNGRTFYIDKNGNEIK